MADREYGTEVMPPQRLSYKKKTDAWREQCVDSIDGLATNFRKDGRTSRHNKRVNYDLMNSIYEESDFAYVLDPMDIGEEYGKTPARMRDMNLVRERVTRITGEELIRPFDFMVAATNGEAVTIRQEKKMREIHKLATYIIQGEAGVEAEEEPRFKSFEAISKYYDTTYQDAREIWGNDIVNYGLENKRLIAKFNEGFEHGLVGGEEIYYVGLKAGDPDIRVVNSLYFDWEKSSTNSKIEDADWAREEEYLTASEIIDTYSEYLREADVRKLDEGLAFNSYTSGNRMFPGYAYTQEQINAHSGYDGQMQDASAGYIRVVRVAWKSMQKIGFHTYFDEFTGETEEEIVDEDFKLSAEAKAAGELLEWQWINTVWEGTKIGNDIYVNINPIENQMRSQNNPAECKLPYVGGVYNQLNSVSRSIVDLLKPHQYLYNVVWYRLENELAKANGKKMVMDLAQLPSSMGIPFKKWMYYFNTLNIAFINSKEEGADGIGNEVSKFNQFQSLDMALSNTVLQYIGVLDKIEQLMDKVVGLNPQMLGDTHHQETATGVQTAVTNSSYITEHYFLQHEEIKRQVLTQYVECAKYAYSGGTTINYVTSDFNRIAIEVDGEMFNDSDWTKLLYLTYLLHYVLLLSQRCLRL